MTNKRYLYRVDSCLSFLSIYSRIFIEIRKAKRCGVWDGLTDCPLPIGAT